MRYAMAILTAAAAAGVAAAAAGGAAQSANPFLGRWNMTGTGPDAAYVYWLEIRDEGGQLAGTFLNRSGSPGPLAVVKVEDGELVFQGGRPDRPTGPEYRARFEAGRLVGRHTLGAAGGQTRTVQWVGVRPPAWPEVDANGAHTYGAPVALFDGGTMDAWGVQHADRPLGWSVVDGVMVNEKGANNLVSRRTFTDFRIEAEYKLGEASNSGIYLRGRYELQVFDDHGRPAERTGHMAIYGRVAPLVNASRPAGEWQRMEAVFVADRVTVTLNGQRVQDNQPVIGITGGALDNNELAPGPIMVQGDHTGVWMRKMIVTPITARGR